MARQGRIGEAVDEFRAVELAVPSLGHNYSLWIGSLLDHNRSAEALEVIERALQTCSEGGEFLIMRGVANVQLRRLGQAMKDFEEAESRKAPPTMLSFHRARALLELSRLEEAEEMLGVAAETSSSLQHAALVNRAGLRRKLNRPADAMEDLDRAIDLDSSNPEFYVSRGCLKFSLGDRSGANVDYDKALSLDESNISALTHRAGLYKSIGELDAAVADVDRAESLIGGTTQLRRLRAGIAFAERDWDLVADLHRQILEDEPEDTNTLWSLGAAYDNSGHFADAEAIFDRLRRLDDRDMNARLSHAITVSQQGRKDEAIALFREIRSDYSVAADEWMSGRLIPDVLPEYDTVMGDWGACQP
jgi:tetratricopeptide (TPR) repeat protein